MSPTGLLKIMGALAPLMGDPATGAAIVAEIRAMFDAMKRAADAVERIDQRLTNIEERLQHMQLPLSNGEVDQLLLHHYPGNPISVIASAEGVTDAG